MKGSKQPIILKALLKASAAYKTLLKQVVYKGEDADMVAQG